MILSTTVIVIIAICGLLAISAAMFLLSKVSGIPFTVLLIATGIILSHVFFSKQSYYIQKLANYQFYPDVLLYVCLPTLIYEAAFTIDSRLLRHHLIRIITVSIPGVFLGTLVFGTIIGFLSPFNYLTSYLLGAILSATDSVAVISIFRQLGIPRELSVLVEGESLFNSATGFVLVTTILFIMTSGSIKPELIRQGATLFIWNFFGGIAVGMTLTFIFGSILSYIEREPLIELSIVMILAYLTFILAEKIFHVSGVMSTITAGVMMAEWGRTKMSADTEAYLLNILGFMSYIVNALIFLLVGFSVNISTIISTFFLLILVILSMLIARGVIIFLLVPIVDKLFRARPISSEYKTIMWCGGLQGSIGLTLVMTTTHAPHHNVLITLVMGAVLFTILVQGSLIVKLIHWMRLDHPLLADRLARIEAEIMADQKTLKRLPELQGGGLFSYKIAHNLQTQCERDIAKHRSEITKLKKEGLNETKEKHMLYLSCFSIEKSTYYEMFQKGNLSEQAYKNLNHQMDIEIDTMRFHGSTIAELPKSIKDHIINAIAIVFSYLPLLDRVSNYIRTFQAIIDYEEKWALHQADLIILKDIDDIAKTQSIEMSVVNEVKDFYRKRATTLLDYLNNIAEQFPEFVNDIQRRFANRLLLNAKYQAIIEQSESGLLPQTIANELINKYLSGITRLKKSHPEKLNLDPHELLRNVPFFQKIPRDETEEIIKLLKKHNVAAGEVIIKEHDTDKIFYIILRGVVRIVKETDGTEKNIATLIAGDFFGEMSLLFGVERTATCKAITPCILYTLNDDDFSAILKKFPAIEEAIRAEASKRKE